MLKTRAKVTSQVAAESWLPQELSPLEVSASQKGPITDPRAPHKGESLGFGCAKPSTSTLFQHTLDNCHGEH